MRPIKFQGVYQHFNESLYEFREWGPYDGGFKSPSLLLNYKLIGHRQFTGLYDKNGKEIYDGDIVKLTTSGDHTFGKDNYNFHVEYINAGFYYRTPYGLVQLFHNRFEEAEVIGNIYQNPELLK